MFRVVCLLSLLSVALSSQQHPFASELAITSLQKLYSALEPISSPILARVAGEPPKPVLPTQYSTLVNISSGGGFGPGDSAVPASIWFDGPNKRSRIDESSNSLGMLTNVSQYGMANGTYISINKVCRTMPKKKFADMWAWIKSPLAKFNGTHTINGVQCNAWRLTIPKVTDVCLCVTNRNTPLQLNVTAKASGLPGMNVTGSSFTMFQYFGFTPGPVSSSVFALPAECVEPSPICKGGGIQTLQMVVAQPSYNISKYEIINQDTADWLGDTFFTCYDVVSNHTDSDQYSVISLFEVDVDTSWGAYSLCNGYPGLCWGTDNFHVGREAPAGIKKYGGQCSDNTDTGSWYSLPGPGRCNTTDQVLGRDCTWKVKSRVRTVEIKCVFIENGMLETCKEEKSLPFTKSEAIFFRSLTAAVGQGGCPDVPPPSKRMESF